MKKIISVVGARPNFMKVAPLHKELKKYNKIVNHLICHTGQHYDAKMSKIFFDELELPKPDFYLGIGGGSHSEQTAKIMLEFEKVLIKEKPDLIIVFGDVNSTMACSIVASKLNIKIAHVEAGLRSFDRTMPEEINRVITDVIADYLFVSEKSGLKNLNNEGIDENKVFFTGNIMIDNILFCQNKINQSKVLIDLDLNRSNYILVTFHRPKNVDGYEYLNNLVTFLNNISAKRKVVFPIHPRTKKNMIKNDLLNKLTDNIKLIDPIGYIDFMALIQNAKLVITDSGGIQEETTFLKVQCITVRNNTERPCTITEGTNQLIGTNLKLAEKTVNEILSGDIKIGKIPELWDGKTAERIVKIIINNLSIVNFINETNNN